MESSTAADLLLPKWSSKADPGVKIHGGLVGTRGANTVLARISNFCMIRSSTKDQFIAWHSRVRKLILFFCLLLGTGAILTAITTLNVVGHQLAGTETGLNLLPSSIASVYSPHLNAVSTNWNHDQPMISTPSADTPVTQIGAAPASVYSQQSRHKVEIGYVSDPKATAEDDDSTIEEFAKQHDLITPALRESADGLLLYPVNLSTLSDVYHDLSDGELLLRASAESSKRQLRPASVAPKVAYMFLTRGPLPLAPLWERYFRGHGHLYSIYVHAHPNHRPNFPSDSVFYRRNIPSKEVFWGKASVFAAERRLLSNALLRDAANERFVLVSESCIPITPFPIAYEYFTQAEHSFVEAYKDMGRGGIGRYTRIKHWQKLEPEVTRLQWRKGSQWFEMSRALAVTVVGDREYYPKFETILCAGDCVCYVDEHYLSTVLTILAPGKLANRTAHYVDFHRSTAHPFQWEPALVTALALRKITMAGVNGTCTYNGVATRSCHMFARKFSPDTIAPLLRLAATSFGIP